MAKKAKVLRFKPKAKPAARKKPVQWIISGDSHVLEPPDLFEKPLAKEYGEQVPRYLNDAMGLKGKFYFTGLEYIKIDEIVEGDNSTPEKKQLQEELIAASMDPYARLKCIDKDGVWAEILNSTWMLYTMRAKNDRMVEDCCLVYNDWMNEVVSVNRKRLLATGMIHMADVNWAVKELERLVKRGFKSVLINCDARPEWPAYRDKHYDRFWAAAQSADLPITLHIITGNARDPYTLFGEDRGWAWRSTLDVCSEAGPVVANDFILSGLMDRFPKLRLILSEFEVSWLPYWLFRVRGLQTQIGPAMRLPPIKKPIDEYMSRIYHGFVDDAYVDLAIQAAPHTTMMWGSDFPHTRCTYPNSQRIVKEKLGKLGDKKMADMSYFNAARLYDIELPKTRAIAAE